MLNSEKIHLFLEKTKSNVALLVGEGSVMLPEPSGFYERAEAQEHEGFSGSAWKKQYQSTLPKQGSLCFQDIQSEVVISP